MRVVVDTTIWSLALRRRRGALSAEQFELVRELESLIVEGRALLLGVVRQEVLTGVRDAKAFARLRAHLRHFDDVPTVVGDFEAAAELSNRCLAKGVAGASTDFLICAMADRRSAAVFTTDDDFARYAKAVPVRLHAPRRQRTS